MSTATGTVNASEVENGNWKAGVIGGTVGALAMGILVILMNQPTIAVAIPSLYGLAPPAGAGAGLFVQGSHEAVLGVVFAAICGAVDPDSTRKLSAAVAQLRDAVVALAPRLRRRLGRGVPGGRREALTG